MNDRPESLHDQIATLVQTGHRDRKTSDEVASEIMALLARSGVVRSAA